MVLVTVPLNAFALCGRAGGHTMMKKLLLLVSIAVPRKAVAEDAQCVRERAAMVETIFWPQSLFCLFTILITIIASP